jgi:bifunctional non-homologous end joining protein LigD
MVENPSGVGVERGFGMGDACIIKYARLDRGKIQLLTRTGLDWSRRYPRTVEALSTLPVKTAYLDGELCALRPDGVPAFSRLQAAMDEGRTDDLEFLR